MGLDDDMETIREAYRGGNVVSATGDDLSADMLSSLLSNKPDVIVYSGHTDTNGLLIKVTVSTAVYITGDEFVRMLKSAYEDTHPACVVLSSCKTSDLARNISNLFPCTPVIYWETLVLTSAALLFTKTLLESLSRFSKYQLRHRPSIMGAYRKAKREYDRLHTTGDPMQPLSITPDNHNLHHASMGYPLLPNRSQDCLFCWPRVHGVCRIIVGGTVMEETNPNARLMKRGHRSPGRGDLHPRTLFEP